MLDARGPEGALRPVTAGNDWRNSRRCFDQERTPARPELARTVARRRSHAHAAHRVTVRRRVAFVGGLLTHERSPADISAVVDLRAVVASGAVVVASAIRGTADASVVTAQTQLALPT